jgi:hypothetical protein
VKVHRWIERSALDAKIGGEAGDENIAPERAIHLRSALLVLGPNNDCGHVRSINGGIEKFGAGQLRKMHELVSYLLDFPANLLAGFHTQLDRLTGVPLQNTDDGIARLKIDFALGEKAGASENENEGGEKWQTFHIVSFCRRTGRFTSEYCSKR